MMKKLLLIILLCFGISNSANITWLGTSASAKDAANWVGGVLPAVGDVWVLSSTNNNALTVDSNFTNAGISADAGYTATVSLQTYTVRTTGSVALGGAVLSAGTSNFRLVGTSGTQAITSAGEAWYDFQDSSMSTATISTSDAFSCHTFTKYTTSTGALTLAGDSVACSGDMVIDGASSPAVTMGTALNMHGASSTAHWGSGLGTTTATSLVEYWNTGTSGTRDDDKGITALALYCTGKVTNSGAATTTYSTAGVPLTLGGNSKLTLTRAINLRKTATGKHYSVNATDTIAGSATLSLVIYGSSILDTFPELLMTGNQLLSIYEGNSITGTNVYQTGAIINSNGPMEITTGSANSSWIYNMGNITTGSLKTGCGNTGATLIVRWQNSIVSITSFLGDTYKTGTSIDSLGSALVNCTGALTLGTTGHSYIPGTSIIRYVGTGVATWTFAGKRLSTVIDSGSAASKLTLADSLVCDSTIALKSGKFDQAKKPMYCRYFINSTPDSVYRGGTLWVSGDFTRTTGTSLTVLDSAMTRFYKVTGQSDTHTVKGGGFKLGLHRLMHRGGTYLLGDSVTVTRFINDTGRVIGTGKIFTVDSLKVKDTGCVFGGLNVVAWDSLFYGIQQTTGVIKRRTINTKQIVKSTDTVSIDTLIAIVDSVQMVFGSNKGTKILYTDTATLNGSSTKYNYYTASTPGTRARLYLPAIDTLKRVSFKDCSSNVVIQCANLSTTLGNNRNLKFMRGLSVIPARGTALGGTPFAVSGNGLIAGGALFGTAAATSWTVLSNTSATGVSPAGMGLAVLKIYSSDSDTVTVAGGWQFVSPVSGAGRGLSTCGSLIIGTD